MKKISLVLICLFFAVQFLSAQSDEIKKVEKVIETMFEGMRLGDSAMVSQVFHPDAEFFSAHRDKEGKSILSEGSVREWLNAIGTPHDEVWNEEWWDPSIHIDGNFAHAWTPYAFYVDDTFSHCGVDSFHLILDDSGDWKVFHATDTRRKSGCDEFIPKHITDKHEK